MERSKTTRTTPAQFVAISNTSDITKKGTRTEVNTFVIDVVSTICSVAYGGGTAEELITGLTTITEKHKDYLFVGQGAPFVVNLAQQIMIRNTAVYEAYVDRGANFVCFVSMQYNRNLFRSITKAILDLDNTGKIDFIYCSKEDLIEPPVHDCKIEWN